MKLFNSAKISMVLFIMLEGCPSEGPYHFLTQVNQDGSCRREFIRTADSAFVILGDTAHNPFPMKLDSTWKLTTYKRYEGDTSLFVNWPAGKTYIDEDSGLYFSWFVRAQKEYPSVEQMAASFRFDNSVWNNVIPEIQLHKKFRWFYTFYVFSETYPKSNPFSIIPISDYMTSVQADALYGENKELYRGKNGFEILNELKDLNDLSEKWLEHNMYEEFYKLYIDNYERFKNAPVNIKDFTLEKDTIYKYYIKTDSFDFTDFDNLLNHHFHTNAYTTDEEFENVLETKFALLFTDDLELNYRLSLPGKVIETNAPFINKDTLSWKVDFDRFYFSDYKLEATSRRPNIWAFVVTGIIILAAILAFTIVGKRGEQIREQM